MKLKDCFEGENQEFKTSLAELDKGIIALTAMLNKSGRGKVYFGVANDGTVIGLEGSIGQETIKKIGVRISEQVRPVIIPKITFESYEDHVVIVVEAEGYNKPYSAAGEYRIRMGSENKKIDPSILSEMVLANSITQMENVESINQSLTFEQLKGLYRQKGLTVNDDNFLLNTGLLTKKGTFNYLADILSDNNNVSIKVVRFRGKDKMEMIARNEFGFKCLLLSMRSAYDYVAALDEVRVDLDSDMIRKELPLFDLVALDEAWTNACLHNKWIKNVPPAMYIFDDRIEIVSTGGLPFDFTKEEFFDGVSRPVNIGLQKIMGQLGMVEQTGHGVPRIIRTYGTQVFDIAENHITVTIPFAFTPSFKQTNYDGLTASERKVLEAIKNNPTASILTLCEITQIGKTRLSEIINALKKSNRIERVGKTRGGYWVIK